MKNKIKKILGKEFMIDHNIIIKGIKTEEDIIYILLGYNNTGSMFKIDRRNNLEESVNAIKSIIKNEVSFK